MKTTYITTAIDYANGSPHLGHAYEKVLADVIARSCRLMGKEVYLVTGLDEHGQKVQQAAQSKGVSPGVLCDKIAKEFQELCIKLNISNDDYIRTTENRHKKVVQAMLQKVYDRGDIYKSSYRGYYSPRTEQFLNERDKVDGKWPDIYGEVIEIEEENYFFKLSRYKDWLIDYICQNPHFIFPAFRQKQVLEFLKEPINDLCISRPKTRLSWGISLPFDDHYVTYVWFDALLNYISVLDPQSDLFQSCWPADYHIIGKDILVPPHAVYWPIMLKAMDIEMPRCFVVHGWWNISGQKMSKSTGNIIDPIKIIDTWGADAFRYFLMREMHVGQDSDFSESLFFTRYNSDLANDLGNLVSRLLNMVARYTDGEIPKALCETMEVKAADSQSDSDSNASSIPFETMWTPEFEIKTLWEVTRAHFLDCSLGLQFHNALDHLFQFIRGINRYAEQRKPWNLAKSDHETDRKTLHTALAFMAEGIRLASAALTPFMPDISVKMNRLLALDPVKSWNESLSWGNTLHGNRIGEKAILFPRIEMSEKDPKD